jgi:hypothetical protein
MPAPKQISAYPQMYWDIAEAAATGHNLEMEFPTRGKALTFRNRIYGFKTALDRYYQRNYNSKNPIVMAELPKVEAYLKFAEQMTVLMEPITTDPNGPTKATVMHKDNTPYAKSLQEAIEKATGKRPETLDEAIAASQARLLEKMKGKV